MTLTEKTAYIKGLAEGLNISSSSSPEAKLIIALVDLCDEMSNEIANLQSDVEDLNDYIEEIDEDLGCVEEVLLDDDCDCDCDCDCDDCDDCDGDCDCCQFADDCDFEDEDEEYYEIVCPSCGETVCFDESISAEEILCPACGATLGSILEDDEDEK